MYKGQTHEELGTHVYSRIQTKNLQVSEQQPFELNLLVDIIKPQRHHMIITDYYMHKDTGPTKIRPTEPNISCKTTCT